MTGNWGDRQLSADDNFEPAPTINLTASEREMLGLDAPIFTDRTLARIEYQDVPGASATSTYLLFRFGGPPDDYPKTRKNGSERFLNTAWLWYFDSNSAALEAESKEIQALYWKSKDDEWNPKEQADIEQIWNDLANISNSTTQLSDNTAQSRETTSAVRKPEIQEDMKMSSREVPIHAHQPSPGMIDIWKKIGHPVPKDMEDGTRPKHFTWSFAPLDTVNLTLMGAVVVTCRELLTFFPNHLSWHDRIMRFYESGWKSSEMMNVIYWVRDWEKKDGNMFSRTDKKMPKGKDGTRPPPSARSPSVDLTCGTWTPPQLRKGAVLVDYYVQDLAMGVRREKFPRGPDKGGLTLAIEHVLDHPLDAQCQNLKLGGLEGFIQAKGFGQTPGGSNDPHPDVAARARHVASRKSTDWGE